MVDDICRALVYVRDHIHEHCPQADPNQLFLSGHSAGAHLISLLVLNKSYLLRHALSPASVRGLIVMSGVYSLSNPTHDSANNIRNWIYRILYSSSLLYPKGKTCKDYSPIEYVKSDVTKQQQLPAVLVMSARFDMGLEIDAKRFVERLRTCQYQVEYFVVGGLTDHGTIVSRFSKNDAHRHFFEFIRQHKKYWRNRNSCFCVSLILFSLLIKIFKKKGDAFTAASIVTLRDMRMWQSNDGINQRPFVRDTCGHVFFLDLIVPVQKIALSKMCWVPRISVTHIETMHYCCDIQRLHFWSPWWMPYLSAWI